MRPISPTWIKMWAKSLGPSPQIAGAKFQEDRSPRSYGIEIPPLARTRVVRGNAMSCKDLAGFVSMRRYHVAWYVPYSLLLKMMSNIFSYQLPQSSVVESFAANVLDAVRIVLVS